MSKRAPVAEKEHYLRIAGALTIILTLIVTHKHNLSIQNLFKSSLVHIVLILQIVRKCIRNVLVIV